MTPFQLVNGWTVTTPLDAMLTTNLTSEISPERPKKHVIWHDTTFNNHSESIWTGTTFGEERSNTHCMTKYEYRPFCEQLASLKSFSVVTLVPWEVLHRISLLNCEVSLEGHVSSSRCQRCTGTVHGVRIKQYYDQQWSSSSLRWNITDKTV